MLNLVLKDLRFQKKNLMFIIAYLILFGFIFSDEQGFNIATMIIPLGMLILGLTPWRYDDYYNMDIIFCSMPVRRSDIVIARYVGSLIYVIFMTLIIMLLAIIINVSNLEVFGNFTRIKLGDYTLGIIYALVIIATTFPIYFKFGTKKGKITVALFMGIFMAMSVGMEKFTTFFNQSYNATLGFIACCILFVISIFISLNIYNKVEL